jgi:hypothetical protein
MKVNKHETNLFLVGECTCPGCGAKQQVLLPSAQMNFEIDEFSPTVLDLNWAFACKSCHDPIHIEKKYHS